jgi:PHD/YefM family antitoxin component YafN of YafNO toxin-antitoxin module
MEFVPIRDLCASPRKITQLLKKESRLVITTNGQPTAIMLDVDPSSFEETLFDLRSLAAKRALRELQEASVANGTSSMSLEEINNIIAATRKERIAREQSE